MRKQAIVTVTLMVIMSVLAACVQVPGGPSKEPLGTPAPVPTETAVPKGQPTTQATIPAPGPTKQPLGTPAPTGATVLYGHAADWSWVAGRVLPTMGPSSCVTLQFDPSGKDSGGLVAVPQLPAGLSQGDFVRLSGHLGSGEGTSCAGRDKVFLADTGTRIQTPTYGHADDYSWIAGQYAVTRIQGGCDFVTYDPAGQDQYHGRMAVSGDAFKNLQSGDWVVVYGKINTGAQELCPGGQSYSAERAEKQ